MPFTMNSKLKEVLENPEAAKIYEKYLPGSLADTRLKMAYNMTLKAISTFPQSKEMKAKLPQILEELNKLS